MLLKNLPYAPRVLAVALAFAPLLAVAAQPGLTFEEALRLAGQASATNRAAQASVDASIQAAARAAQLPDPMLKLGIENLPVSGPDRWRTSADFMTMRRIGIEQQWISSDKRQARAARAGKAMDMEQAARSQNAATVREEAGKAWFAVLYAQRAAELYRQLAREMAEDLAGTEAAHRGAKANAVEVLQTRLTLVQARDDVSRAEQEQRSAAVRLSRWLRRPVDVVDDVVPALTVTVADVEPAGLERSRPSVLAARRAIALADADTAVATRERHPDWSFEAGFSQRGSQYGNMVSFGVTIPLPVNRAQRQDRDVAEKSAQGTRARLLYEDTVFDQQTQVQVLRAELDNLTGRIARLNGELLPAAKAQVELAIAAYRAASGPLAAIFQARRALLEKRLQINGLEQQAALTWAALELPALAPAAGNGEGATQ
ncbi:TolC family protein [Massilia sp. YMA4]|uniref:TolC family protein n=1 Tax=[Empedobacter] haloabium TaxID=592317 RepID=A0ABZ1URH1_9BURK|nr:TolC family protein [Massilia sp. YMA4]AXA91370.1 TolC family protein [Massilia sp. YMA4]